MRSRIPTNRSSSAEHPPRSLGDRDALSVARRTALAHRKRRSAVDYSETMAEASAAVLRSTVEATSADDLIERIRNYSMGHLIMDDVTAVVVRRIA
jgi:hypothetical protein